MMRKGLVYPGMSWRRSKVSQGIEGIKESNTKVGRYHGESK
jgi:hypothetical protein